MGVGLGDAAAAAVDDAGRRVEAEGTRRCCVLGLVCGQMCSKSVSPTSGGGALHLSQTGP